MQAQEYIPRACSTEPCASAVHPHFHSHAMVVSQVLSYHEASTANDLDPSLAYTIGCFLVCFSLSIHDTESKLFFLTIII